VVVVGRIALSKMGKGSFQESDGLHGTPDLLRALESVSRATIDLTPENSSLAIAKKIITRDR